MPSTRSELKKRFNPSSNATPTGGDYAVLINSVLNLRDDQFYGVWQPDAVYYNGGLVFHEKAFYQLQHTPDTAYCSIKPPGQDTLWHKIQENVVDDDWFFSADKLSLHANPTVVSVGIGTPNPQATLEVAAKDCGTIKLQPNLKDPRIKIVNRDPGCKENCLKLRVTTDAAELETDSQYGLRIFKNNKEAVVKQVRVLTANATDSAEPRVGIGTDAPQAHLQVSKQDAGTVKIDGGESGGPSLTIEKNESSSLLFKVGVEQADLVVNNSKGLFFKKMQGSDSQTHLVINDKGNVGIGVEKPEARIHVVTLDNRDGAIKLDFCKTYPVLNLINNRVPTPDGGYNNAFSVGAATDAAVLKTDSTEGFVFKTPAKTPSDEYSICDLNEGTPLVHIYANGVLTVGDLDAGNFKLDVDAFARSMGYYTEADRQKIDPQACEAIPEVMKRICALNPVRFKWKNPPPFGTDGQKDDEWKLGLIADEVKPQFSEVVMDDAIAYQNMVPILIQAIKEQQGMIETLQKEVAALKHKPHH